MLRVQFLQDTGAVGWQVGPGLCVQQQTTAPGLCLGCQISSECGFEAFQLCCSYPCNIKHAHQDLDEPLMLAHYQCKPRPEPQVALSLYGNITEG
jgi:hypothetical protein